MQEEERNLNFDEVTDRTHTDSLKFDFHKRKHKPQDAFPLWVADMDFRTSSFIEDALVQRARHGIFGYTETGQAYRDAVDGWMKKQYGWNSTQDYLIKSPGVVPSLGAIVTAFTEKDDPVLIQQPVYYCFTEVIECAGRRVVSNDLIFRNNRYEIDYEDFEKKIVDNRIHLFLLCNPHNPGGRSWTREELRRLGEICVKHHVIVASDEIHADFTFPPAKHVVFETLSPAIGEQTITCTSPGKTFNISALQIGNVLVRNHRLFHQLKKTFLGNLGYSQANAMGITACETAYTKGDVWYQAMLRYVEDNVHLTEQYLKDNLPEIVPVRQDATYLMFLDFRNLHMTEEEREDLLLNKAHLWLDSGAIFGKTGEGFERINVATQRSTLLKALDQLRVAVEEWRQHGRETRRS